MSTAQSVDLREIAVRLNTERQQREIQLEMKVYQQRVPFNHENLLMALSDVLLRAIQRWVTSRKLSMSSKCCVSLHAVELLALPMKRCLVVLPEIPVFTFYPWSTQISRNMLAMMDALSFNLLLAKLQNPAMELKLVITIY